jgi:hypothetical protein
VLDDFCRLRNGETRHFVRGLIELPIRGSENYFGYGVWIETTEGALDRLGDSWHDDEATLTETGFIANELDAYPGSRGLQVTLTTRKVLPFVAVEDQHRLGDEQNSGISRARANELSASILH